MTPDVGREAANVLLDAAAVADTAQDGSVDAVQLALQRLFDIGAITVDVDGDDVSVNIGDLVGPAVATITWLLRRVAELEHGSPEEVVSDVREFWATVE